LAQASNVGEDPAYLSYGQIPGAFGISHQKSNLQAMAREAWLCNRVLVPPKFRLSANHNFGREILADLGDYYDFDTISVEGHPIRVDVSIPQNLPKVVLGSGVNLVDRSSPWIHKRVARVKLLRLRLHATYRVGFNKGEMARVSIRPDLKLIAKTLRERLPDDVVWVHVRRGDSLRRTRAHTTSSHISKTLQAVVPTRRNVYLATNETNQEHFAELRSQYMVFSIAEFPELVQIRTYDNYKVYLIEEAIGELCDSRISTFRTESPYYTGYLCPLSGSK
jgi:hypothetical protein